MALEVKTDSRILGLWGLIIGGLGYSSIFGYLDWKLAIGFLMTLGLPSVLGTKRKVWSERKREGYRQMTTVQWSRCKECHCIVPDNMSLCAICSKPLRLS